MPDIDIAAADANTYDVTITADDGHQTSHRVWVPPSILTDLGLSEAQEPVLVRASMAYLLEREPPSSILPQFGLDEIARFFPNYPTEIGTLL
jgi:hypothetical protein